MSLYRDGLSPDLDLEIEPDRRRRNRLLAFAAGAGTALLVSFVVGSVQSSCSTPYGATVDQLMTTAPRAGAPVRVQGDLVVDSLVRRREAPCEVRFAIERNGFRMPVHYASCILSDQFELAIANRLAVPIIVEGELQPGGFVARGVMARVPSCCFCGAKERRKQLESFMQRRQP